MRRTGLVTLLLASITVGFAACRNEIEAPNPEGTTPPASGTTTPIVSGTATPPPGPADRTVSVTTTITPCFTVESISGSRVAIADTAGGAVSAIVDDVRVAFLLQVKKGTAPSGSTNAVNDPSEFGAWDLQRVVDVIATNGGSRVDLLQPPVATYSVATPDLTELCLLPYYGHFVLTTAGGLVADAWDGARGGVVGLVADTAQILGSVEATSKGYRGGESFNDVTDCANGNQQSDPTVTKYGAAKGEGPDGHAGPGGPPYGQGNRWIAGGGGNASASGGGGGGNGGAGGRGGNETLNCSVSDTTNHGKPGVSIALKPEAQLSFGGAGGGGQGHASADGGPGGGIVLLVARSLAVGAKSAVRVNGGNGTMPGNGSQVPDTAEGGGGGGGAAGTILLVADGGTVAGKLRAVGGGGGKGTIDVHLAEAGCGGGGGGGRVEMQGPRLTGAIVVDGGSPDATCAGANNESGSFSQMLGVAGTATVVSNGSFFPF